MKNFSQKSREAYNKKAADYDNTHDGKVTHKFKQLLNAELDLDGVSCVLDVGCGNGTMLKILHDRKNNISGFGVDVSEKMIQYAAASNPGMEFYVAECHAMPFGNATMDIIIVCAAYHHFPDVAAFATEAARILKPKGKLMIAELYLPPLLKSVANIVLPFSKAGDHAIYSPQEITDNLEAHGFNNVNAKIYGRIQIVSAQRVTA